MAIAEQNLKVKRKLLNESLFRYKNKKTTVDLIVNEITLNWKPNEIEDNCKSP